MPLRPTRERLYIDLPASSMAKLNAVSDHHDLTRTAAVAYCISVAFNSIPEKRRAKMAYDHGVRGAIAPPGPAPVENVEPVDFDLDGFEDDEDDVGTVS